VYINIVSVDGWVRHTIRDFRIGRGSGRRHGGMGRGAALNSARESVAALMAAILAVLRLPGWDE